MTPQVWLPNIPINENNKPPSWSWTKHGFGHPTGFGINAQVLLNTGSWWYNWGMGHENQQIPMLYSGSVDSSVWLHNDGRPILVLNEPEDPYQSDVIPVQAATVVKILQTNWIGEIWGFNTLAHKLDYCDAVCDAYEELFDKPMQLTGWSIHVYSNRAVFAPDINSVDYVPAALDDLDTFIAHQKAAGRLGRGVIISEYGALSQQWRHPTSCMVDMFAAYEYGFSQREDVLSWAAFSSYYPELNSTDLLFSNGSPTQLGSMWLGYCG